MINQAPIVRYMASVCEIFFADFCKKTFSAESHTFTTIFGSTYLFSPKAAEFHPAFAF
jgi:hypothetical protein